MNKTITLLSLFFPLTMLAQNPVIRSLYSADPTARVFNGKLYLYPSHDIPVPEGHRKDWFSMADYHVFSSENLTDWQDHGVIVTQEEVPWGKADGYSMWAPDCVCKNGKYYFYFPNAPKEGRGFAVGVATADSPEGPFTCEPAPIAGISGIDPCVLIDNDGQSYIYWASMGIRGAKLKENMKEIDAVQEMEGLPEGFKEGPFVFRRGDWYYLTFPWVRGSKENGNNPTETLAYAMSKSPLGPWDFKGIIMAEHDNGCWTNHHSLVAYKEQWYLFYHNNFFSPNDDKRRSVCIEKVAFNADGTIQEVKPTRRGVGINKATERIEVDRYNSLGNGGTVSYVDTTNYLLGQSVTLPGKGGWVRYDGVDFSGITDGYVIIHAKASENTEFSIREKNNKGKVIARMKITVVSEDNRPFRHDMRNQWMTLTAPIANTPKGITDLCITAEGKPVSIDWVQFKNRPNYFSTAADTDTKPDEQGFIRRWRLLEPLAVDVRSNIVFTDSWLRAKFADELAKLPKQKGKWYTLDSENYNMKLFRFAEKYGKQTYGSFFWCETIIDCPEEIRNVRLACGSNGASMWWLNEEEVLLLEGDRRMVEDDGVSQRLTLKKGRNILRCAVINGPGLSDMCTRFVDEKGNPVKDYQITISK